MFWFGKKKENLSKLKCVKLRDLKRATPEIKRKELILVYDETKKLSDISFINDCNEVCYACQMEVVSDIMEIKGYKFLKVRKI